VDTVEQTGLGDALRIFPIFLTLRMGISPGAVRPRTGSAQGAYHMHPALFFFRTENGDFLTGILVGNGQNHVKSPEFIRPFQCVGSVRYWEVGSVRCWKVGSMRCCAVWSVLPLAFPSCAR